MFGDVQRTIKELQVEYGRVLTMLEMARRANDEQGVSQLADALQRMYAMLQLISFTNSSWSTADECVCATVCAARAPSRR